MRYLKTQFQICLEQFLFKHSATYTDSQRKYFFVGPYYNFFKLIVDENFKTLRNSLFTQIASNRREPFDHATKYLVSSNKLLDVDSRDIYYTYLPCVSTSAFSCELFIKAWIVEDQIREVPSPYNQVKHVLYDGSDARPYLTQSSLPRGATHNLKELFLALPTDIKDFHIFIYDCIFKPNIQLSLMDALDIVKEYFIDSRYFFESPNSQYNLYLINDLANFFYEVFLFLYNWDGKVLTGNE